MKTKSVARNAKEVANDVKVLEVVLLAEISIMLCLPEAACTHVKTGFSFLKADQRGKVLVVRRDFLLALFDDLLAAPVD